MDSYLGQHPDIFMGPKELHYFCTDLLDEDQHRPLDNYLSFFQGRSETVRGENSVFYLYSKIAAQHMKDFAPDAKILIHLRNPLDVIASHHAQSVYMQGEPEEDLEKALALEERRARGEENPTDYVHWRMLQYRDFVRFAPQVERYFDVFGRDQVKVNLFDDFQSDTPSVYRDTLEFLGVDPHFRPDFPVVNANRQIKSKWIMTNLVRDPPPVLSTLARALVPSAKLRDDIRWKIEAINMRRRPRDPVTPALRAALADDLRDDVAALSDLLNRDLSHWLAAP